MAFLAGGLTLGFEGLSDPVQYQPVFGMSEGTFLLLELGLVTVGLMSVMLMGITLSVLLESAVVPVIASMAIMATGYIGVAEATVFPGMKYLFTTHVSLLVRHFTGSIPRINGVPAFAGGFGFSLWILLLTALFFIASSALIFSRRQAPA